MKRYQTIEDDDERVIRDGEVLTTSVSLLDSAQKAVAFDAVAARARIADAHARYRHDLCNRWRGPASEQKLKQAPASPSPTPSPLKTADQAYREYDERLANRWR